MSAFMVEDKTINKVLAGMSKALKDSYSLRDELRKLDTDFKVVGDFIEIDPEMDMDAYLESFGKAMFKLNINSVNARYGSGAEQFRNLDYKYSQVNGYTNMEILKALQCFLYQACEGMCEYTDLYKFLNGPLKSYLMSQIIYKLPEYDLADWG